jgi:kinetochore protein Mis12/MTW1
MNIVLYKCTDGLESALLSAEPEVLGFTSTSTNSTTSTASQPRPTNGDTEGDAGKKSELEINEGIHSLETLMINAIDKNFDRLEIWTLRNVLTLGNMPGDEELGRWIRLGHYQVNTYFLFPSFSPLLSVSILLCSTVDLEPYGGE